jgi:hypothetical protein
VIEKAHKTRLFGAGDRAHLEMLQAIMFAEAHFFMTLAKWGCPMAARLFSVVDVWDALTLDAIIGYPNHHCSDSLPPECLQKHLNYCKQPVINVPEF